MMQDPVFTIKGTRTRACVMADGVRISSWSGLEQAMRVRDEIEAAGTYKNRKCMSWNCNTVFLSEGAHHRMCSRCRHNSAPSFDVAV